MNDDQATLKVKVTNQLNGEIIEREVRGADAAEQLYMELKASERALKVALNQTMSFLETWLGEDNEQVFADGRKIVRVQRESRVWTKEGLHAVGFDDDALAVVTKVDMKAAKELVDEAIERGEIKPDSKKVLNESAEVSFTKPYVQIK